MRGPAAERGAMVLQNILPSGSTTVRAVSMSSIFPYLVENCPAARQDIQPPRVEHLTDWGVCLNVKPFSCSFLSRISPLIPVSTVTSRLSSSISMMRFILFMSITMPPLTAVIPPRTPEPSPKGITGTLYSRAILRMAAISSADSGHTMASGKDAILPSMNQMLVRGQKSLPPKIRSTSAVEKRGPKSFCSLSRAFLRPGGAAFLSKPVKYGKIKTSFYKAYINDNKMLLKMDLKKINRGCG